jgi:hypothetical protein
VAPEETKKRRPWLIALIVAIAVAVAAVIVVLTNDDSSASATVTLERSSEPGSDPFTDSVAIGPVVDFPSNVRAVATSTRKKLKVDARTNTLTAAGTDVGLYGGTDDARACDAQKLVKFLEENPTKAAAWAGVLGISRSDIASYIEQLTPVVLTNDTLVTNHGFREGRATSLQSVLEAGTAVMVDATGVPRVKCNCGNPLTPAEPINLARVKTTGVEWAGYSSREVTTVTPGAPTDEFTVINVRTGIEAKQPAGSGSAGQWVAARLSPGNGDLSTTIETSPDGARWSEAHVFAGLYVHAIAFGGGTWLALGQTTTGSGGEHVFASSDLRSWKELPALNAGIDDLAYANGRWVAIGQRAVPPTHVETVIFTGTETTGWTAVAPGASAGGYRQAVTYANGTWLASIPIGDIMPADLQVYASTDGRRWTPRGDQIADATNSALAHGDGRSLLAAEPTAGGVSRVFESRDSTEWTAARTSGLRATIGAIAYGNGTWLAADESESSAFYISTNGTTWTRAGSGNGTVTSVAFGPGGASRTNPPTTTPTTAPGQTGSVSSTQCPWQDTGGIGLNYQPPPSSVTLPTGVTVPDGAAVFASDPRTYFIAPRGFRCAAEASESDFRHAQMVDPSNPARFVEWSSGGAGQEVTEGCSYFPQQRAYAAANPTLSSECPAAPRGVASELLPTSDGPGHQIAVVSVPAGVVAPSMYRTAGFLESERANDVAMLAVFDAGWSLQGPSAFGGATVLRCALPPDQMQICINTLRIRVPAGPARDALDTSLADHSG